LASYHPRDRASVTSDEFAQLPSPSPDSGIHSEINYRQRSITPIDHMTASTTR